VTAYYSNRAIENRRGAVRRYLERRQLYPFQVAAEPSADLGLIVVIPCFDEPDVATTLASLSQCEPPGCDVEILVVVNAPEGAAASVLENNDRALSQVADAGHRFPDWLRCYALTHANLPDRRAGVGLARKIGMDEAAARIAGNQRCDGAIVSLDADCVVESNFLARIRQEFMANEQCPGVSIYFEHPVPARDMTDIRDAIIDYELHLRYYVFGQRIARFPFAFHTVGSSMACRAGSYARLGGMNRRQAGEDFYFIQKLVEAGGYRVLNATTVYPGVRVSDRVPFGTGAALKNALATGEPMTTFAPEIFRDLACFCEVVASGSPETFEADCRALPASLAHYLEENRFADRLTEIRRNVSAAGTFRRRIFRWFNAFRLMKFAQFASESYYPRVPVARAAHQLARSAGVAGVSDTGDLLSLLVTYRQLDRQTATHEILDDSF
jgi:hypothetical protein